MRQTVVAGLGIVLQPTFIVYEALVSGQLIRLLPDYDWRELTAIVSKQLAMKRLADIVIDLFVGLSVLARASSLTDGGDVRYQQAINVAKLFSQQAKRRMNQNFRRIMRNEDEDLKKLAQFIFSERAYPWDVL